MVTLERARRREPCYVRHCPEPALWILQVDSGDTCACATHLSAAYDHVTS